MPPAPDDPTTRLGDAFAQHAAPGEGVTLAQMADPAWTGLAPEPEMISLLLTQQKTIAPFLRDRAPQLAPLLRDQLVRWVHAKNQFVDFDRDALADLEAAFRRRLEMLAQCISSPEAAADPDPEARAESVREVFRTAHRALATILRTHLGKEPREVPNHEYSPELQLRLLGFSLDAVTPPVLDIGCGAHANLVLALRAAGHAAEGLDRDVPAELGTQTDWRRFDFPADRYGTIVSHQAFSLHFLHQELGKKEAAFAYAKMYMAILRALRAGGTFAYAPGLPFIEAHLSAKSYRCERIELPDELRETPMLRALGEHLGDDVAYAARVRRIT